MMGGEIGFDSEPGVGTTFRFTVRLEVLPTAEQESGLHEGQLAGHGLLVVCGQPEARRHYVAMATELGMAVRTVGDGEAGLTRLREAARIGKPFDVALYVITGGGLDSEVFAKRTAADSDLAHTELVQVTRAGVGDGSTQPSDTGYAKYLPDPVNRETLLACFAELGVGGRSGPVPVPVTPAPAAPAMHGDLGAELGEAPRVLIAEDNRINQLLARTWLEKMGCQVTVVENGLEAVEAVSKGDFALVLMDIRMPEMDGVAATRAIRALPGPAARIPIVAVTANAMVGDDAKYLAAGMDDYMAKPIEPEKLRATLQRWLVNEPNQSDAPNRSPTTPPAELPATDDALDNAVLQALDDNIGRQETFELVQAYLEASEQRIGEMETMAAAAEIEALRREAHDLKSTSGSFGAIVLSRQAAALEAACREQREAELRDLMAPIPDSFVAARQALEARYPKQRRDLDGVPR